MRLKVRRGSAAPARKKVTAADAELVTIPNVEIVSVGEYDLASGKTTFTEADLAAAVAAQADPAVQQPRLGIGHQSKFADGEPAFGTITNMRLADNNQKIVGDYEGVPQWLAKILPTAYPSRSIEGGFQVETASGRKHDMVITHVKLLGITAPGVSDLEDLVSLYGAEPPNGVEVIAGEAIEAKMADQVRPDVTAAVNVEDVRRAFYDQLDASQAYWWVRTMQLNPNQLIVDDDNGHLYQVDFSITADGEVEFDDPTEVEVEYVPVNATSSDRRQVAVFASRSESRPEPTEQEGDVDLSQIRERLGLPEETSDEDVLKAAHERLPAASNGDGEGEPEGEPESDDAETQTEGEEGEPQGEPSGAPQETVASQAEGTVQVDAEEWKRLNAAATQGQQAYQKQQQEDRNRVLASAVKEGRIPPSRKEHYNRLWDQDPEGTKKLLTASVEEGGLAPNVVPIREDGGAPGDDTSLQASEYDRSWLSPGERARAEGQQTGQPVITHER